MTGCTHSNAAVENSVRTHELSDPDASSMSLNFDHVRMVMPTQSMWMAGLTSLGQFNYFEGYSYIYHSRRATRPELWKSSLFTSMAHGSTAYLQ